MQPIIILKKNVSIAEAAPKGRKVPKPRDKNNKKSSKRQSRENRAY